MNKDINNRLGIIWILMSVSFASVMSILVKELGQTFDSRLLVLFRAGLLTIFLCLPVVAIPAFRHIIEKKCHLDWNENDKAKQLSHRGLYVEYNLIYDRGTKFGLSTGHDPDAVLMSLPPMASWS